MMRAQRPKRRRGAELHGVSKPIVAAVTVLTSMDTSDLDMVAKARSTNRLEYSAQLTKRRRSDGVAVLARN